MFMFRASSALFNINLIDSLIIVEDSERYTSLLDEGKMEFGGIMASGGVTSTLQYDYYNPYDEYYYPYGEVYNEGKSEWVITKKGKTPEEDLGYWENYKNTSESDLAPTTGRYAGHYWVLLGDDENPIGYWHKLEAGGYMANGGMVVTSIKNIPNFKERLDEGKITYRGLGMGKLYNDFYKLAGQSGTRIKVDGKEYFITDEEFDTFSRGADGKMRIRFDAPQRKGYAKGGYVVINKGGDRYDGGLFYQIEKDGKVVKEGMIDGEAMVDFNGKKYDGLKSLAEGINAELKIEQMKYGGYMANGGEIKKGDLVKVKKYGWIMKVDKIEDKFYYLENDKRGSEISGKSGNPGNYFIEEIELFDKMAYGGYMAKGGDTDKGMKPLSYYKYENASITIIWKGKTQP